MQRLYCYIDESGQDTAAQPSRMLIFVVAIAVFSNNREALERVCLDYEKLSGKLRKWNKERQKTRLEYLRLVLNDRRFHQVLYFAASGPFRGKPDYDHETRVGIVRAFTRLKLSQDYSVDIYLDGISQVKQVEYKRILRGYQIRVHRVHRARDESYPLIRLADALAGLSREALEGNANAIALLRQAKQVETLIEV